MRTLRTGWSSSMIINCHQWFSIGLPGEFKSWLQAKAAKVRQNLLHRTRLWKQALPRTETLQGVSRKVSDHPGREILQIGCNLIIHDIVSHCKSIKIWIVSIYYVYIYIYAVYCRYPEISCLTWCPQMITSRFVTGAPFDDYTDRCNWQPMKGLAAWSQELSGSLAQARLLLNDYSIYSSHSVRRQIQKNNSKIQSQELCSGINCCHGFGMMAGH